MMRAVVVLLAAFLTAQPASRTTTIHGRVVAAATGDPIRNARNGTFAIRGIAPSEYYVAVVDRKRTVDLYNEIENPAFLESLVAGARRITLDEGQRVQIALRSSSR